MTEDFELTLFDRKEVIRKIIKEYGEERFYLSFSGGKDSTMLSVLLDEALPDNKIPRVFINTGIEFRAIVEFVHEKMKNDSRFIEIKPSKPIKAVLEEKGYPFKSKEHSNIVALANNGSRSSSVKAYFDRTDTRRILHCPLLLEYQKDNPPFKISSQCCTELKKKPAHEYERKTGRIAILALRERERTKRKSQGVCLERR